MRASRFLLLTLFFWTAVSAQVTSIAPTELQKDGQPDPRHNQKIERIRIEDNGARIDELRVGGQTQNITVQPKASLPEYEFQPTDLARSRPADNREGLSSPRSQRVWNLLRF